MYVRMYVCMYVCMCVNKEQVDIEAAKRESNFSHPIIGLHVRRGDSCHT